jgi:hypothetical protein
MSSQEYNLASLVRNMQQLNEKFKNQEWTEETVKSTENLLESLNKFIPVLTDMNTKITEFSTSTKTRKELQGTISNEIKNITGFNPIQVENNNNKSMILMGGGFRKKKTKRKKTKGKNKKKMSNKKKRYRKK